MFGRLARFGMVWGAGLETLFGSLLVKVNCQIVELIWEGNVVLG